MSTSSLLCNLLLLVGARNARALANLAHSHPTTRLDAALVARGLCANRADAKAAVLAGRVTVAGAPATKPALSIAGDHVPIACDHTADGAHNVRYVSRAGQKLKAAVDAFRLDVSGLHVLDVGASTGGFTDCMLREGAASVCAIDVGHGQLHPSLAADARVTSLEGVNARELEAERLPRASFDAIVIDVSFISLQLVLPAVWPLLEQHAQKRARLVALVKPQFEAGLQAAKRGKGLVNGPKVLRKVVEDVTTFACELPGCSVVGIIDSPITGGDGQREYLLALAPESAGAPPVVGDELDFGERRASAPPAASAPLLEDTLVAGLPRELRPDSPVKRKETAAARAARASNLRRSKSEGGRSPLVDEAQDRARAGKKRKRVPRGREGRNQASAASRALDDER